MKKVYIAILLLIVFLSTISCSHGRIKQIESSRDRVDSLTYAVFPYLPDVEGYQDLIESRWAQLEPDIELVRADWDCYLDGVPEGIDVIMYDAVMRDSLIDGGWIQPIDPAAVENPEDLFPFSLEGLTVDERLYGIPVFLCGNFLIYDQGCEALATADHITDLADMSEILVINLEDPWNKPQYVLEVLADVRGEANPSVNGSASVEGSPAVNDGSAEDIMQLIDRLAIDAHKNDDDIQVAMAYDSGIGQGYIGFSESMRLLEDRLDQTRIRSISFSDRENMRRLYVDAAAVTAGVKGRRYEKCLELMNVMAEADVLTDLSVREGDPQYLLLARRTPYQDLVGQFPLYAQLETLAGNAENNTILMP